MPPPTQVAAREPTRIPQGVGKYPLPALTGRDAAIRLAGREPVHTVRFQLAPTAKQGDPLWYTVTLHVRASFAPGTSGDYFFIADTNDRAVAAARVIATPTRLIGDQLGRVSGRTRKSTSARAISLTVANYAQYAGIRPGLNRLHLRVRTERGPPPSSVAVLPDTGVAVTKAGPEELKIRAPERRTSVRPGSHVSVPFELTRQGGRPDGPVAVHLDLSSYGIRVVGSPTIRYPSVGSGRRGRFVVEPSEPRGYELVVRVRGRYNEPQARAVIVAAPVRTTANIPLIAAVAAGLGLIAVGLRVRRRASA